MDASTACCTCTEPLERVTHPVPVEWDADNMIKHFPRSWHADEPRRHWEMLQHCEKVTFPKPLPDIPLQTREARFYWHLYEASARHEPFYQQELNKTILYALFRMINRGKSSKEVILSDRLFRLNTFDYLGRKSLVDGLEKYVSQQRRIESFCIDGLGLSRKEGLRLVTALFNSRKTVTHFYCWRAFKRTEGPLLVDTGHLAGSGLYKDRVPRKQDWFTAIGCLDALTTLSMNYAYLATPDGDLLIAFSKKIGLHWHWLQLLCLPEEIPKITDPGDGVGGYAIPDLAWMEAKLWAPCLKVQFVFVGIPEHEKHRKFLTKHTPVHSFVMSTDIDLQFRQPWYLGCTMKMIWTWYPKTLVYIYLQLWHHREIFDTELKKLFPLVPKLRVFEFVGEIRRIETLCAMCGQIRDEECKVNYLSFQLQYPIADQRGREEWKSDIDGLINCFRDTFKEMNVKFEVSFYPC
ncbi:uncharacterized protein LOC124302897 [Neodiprion virginianus]|uniref:uncharacterized protein LOC124302897 n=1 Tax=Neodiprion virginianus TaxID=2961670 RepID=UPI001EE752B8|nr:uncharacterized protein LOC124302897 [Neodiprion virginianus]